MHHQYHRIILYSITTSYKLFPVFLNCIYHTSFHNAFDIAILQTFKSYCSLFMNETFNISYALFYDFREISILIITSVSNLCMIFYSIYLYVLLLNGAKLIFLAPNNHLALWHSDIYVNTNIEAHKKSQSH